MNLNFMKLREQMKNQKVSYYLVPSEDPHQSEYVDDYFKCRQYISGFTGSAGTFLAGCEEGWLWTDGRYFTQAEGQISSDITLMKQGVSSVPTILEFLKEHLQEGDTLGVNGFTISASYGKKIARKTIYVPRSFMLRDYVTGQSKTQKCHMSHLIGSSINFQAIFAGVRSVMRSGRSLLIKVI